MKYYICPKCKKIVRMVKPSACPTMCCNEAMEELVPNTTDGAREKHVPFVSCEGQTVTVQVGEVAHPMLENHFIQWIDLETKCGVQTVTLAAGQEPKAVFALVPGDEAVAAYEYCNLHGFWKKELA